MTMLDLFNHNHDEIIETSVGPQISHSRVMVYDLLAYLKRQNSPSQLAAIFNLTDKQVEAALVYIEQNRETLEKELAEIQHRQQKEQTAYRQRQNQLREKAATLPMTPKRQAFYQLREHNRRRRQQGYANHTQ